MVRTTASSKGEGKKAEAAWDWWCSANSSLPSTSPEAANGFSALIRFAFWNSFSLIHTGIAMRNEA